jgi:hypothetical protein
MSESEIDISDMLDWQEDLPRPRWDLIASCVESRCGSGPQRDAWVGIARQWLAELGVAFNSGYETFESANFLGLATPADTTGPSLLHFAERCRAMLLSVLGGVTDFGDGKQVVVALRDSDDYYRYIAPFYSDGEHGRSAGVHIREGYPHVALYSTYLWELENTLAHELTHAALMTGRALLMVDAEMAREHKRYWSKHGMDAFWRGEGFSRSGKVQQLSYQLAEILVRLLVEEGRPRWFGWVREPQQRFFAFLRGAGADDCGEAACREHLGCGLRDVAARFLGEAAVPPSL